MLCPPVFGAGSGIYDFGCGVDVACVVGLRCVLPGVGGELGMPAGRRGGSFSVRRRCSNVFLVMVASGRGKLDLELCSWRGFFEAQVGRSKR